jgi:hypothetical protein
MREIVVSKQKRQVLKALEKVSPGDLTVVEWYDASVGKSSGKAWLSMQKDNNT